jgi:ribose transport system substrate-binding protein
MKNPISRSPRRSALAAVAMFGVAALTLAGCSTSSSSGSSKAQNKNFVIGISQPFMSNSWQQALVASAKWAAKKLNADGKHVTLKVEDANNNSQTQAQQINDLILSGVDVLLVDPTSPTALNGAIGKAIAAGIPTVAFADGPVSSTAPYELEFNVTQGQKAITQYIATRLKGKGNILNVRGVAGAGSDPLWQKGEDEVLAKYPNLKVVSTVYGNWDESTSQSQVASVLPTLPKIDAIITQGQGYGPAQAFLAAGRAVPLEVFGTPGVDINLWKKLNAENGYTTIASTADAGIGSMAVNVAYALATGKKVPKSMTAPFITIKQPELTTKYANLNDNGSAYGNYDYAWTLKNVINK